MFKKKKNNKGFTLVELLVVIAIIGILAVVAVPSLFKNINKAKVSDIVSYVNAVKTEALSQYADTDGTDGTGITVKTVTDALDGNAPEGTTLSSVSVDATSGKVSITISVPKDIVTEVDDKIEDGSVTVVEKTTQTK